MKKLSFRLGILMFVSAFGLVFSGCATLNPIENLLGVYEGSYTGGNQGETAFTLNVYREGFYYYAVFNFYNLPGMTNAEIGSYFMSMNYNRQSNQWDLKGTQWIEQPIRGNYSFIDLQGVLKENNFSGITFFLGNRAGTFSGMRR